MSNWTWFAGLLFCAWCIAVVGCVRPENVERIKQLEQKIAEASAKHNAGELTTSEAEDVVRAALAEIREVNESERWYNILGAAAVVAIARFLGIPGLASSSGVNLASFMKGLVTKK